MISFVKSAAYPITRERTSHAARGVLLAAVLGAGIWLLALRGIGAMLSHFV